MSIQSEVKKLFIELDNTNINKQTLKQAQNILSKPQSYETVSSILIQIARALQAEAFPIYTNYLQNKGQMEITNMSPGDVVNVMYNTLQDMMKYKPRIAPEAFTDVIESEEASVINKLNYHRLRTIRVYAKLLRQLYQRWLKISSNNMRHQDGFIVLLPQQLRPQGYNLAGNWLERPKQKTPFIKSWHAPSGDEEQEELEQGEQRRGYQQYHKMERQKGDLTNDDLITLTKTSIQKKRERVGAVRFADLDKVSQTRIRSQFMLTDDKKRSKSQSYSTHLSRQSSRKIQNEETSESSSYSESESEQYSSSTEESRSESESVSRTKSSSSNHRSKKSSSHKHRSRSNKSTTKKSSRHQSEIKSTKQSTQFATNYDDVIAQPTMGYIPSQQYQPQQQQPTETYIPPQPFKSGPYPSNVYNAPDSTITHQQPHEMTERQIMQKYHTNVDDTPNNYSTTADVVSEQQAMNMRERKAALLKELNLHDPDTVEDTLSNQPQNTVQQMSPQEAEREQRINDLIKSAKVDTHQNEQDVDQLIQKYSEPENTNIQAQQQKSFEPSAGSSLSLHAIAKQFSDQQQNKPAENQYSTVGQQEPMSSTNMKILNQEQQQLQRQIPTIESESTTAALDVKYGNVAQIPTTTTHQQQQVANIPTTGHADVYDNTITGLGMQGVSDPGSVSENQVKELILRKHYQDAPTYPVQEQQDIYSEFQKQNPNTMPTSSSSSNKQQNYVPVQPTKQSISEQTVPEATANKQIQQQVSPIPADNAPELTAGYQQPYSEPSVSSNIPISHPVRQAQNNIMSRDQLRKELEDINKPANNFAEAQHVSDVNESVSGSIPIQNVTMEPKSQQNEIRNLISSDYDQPAQASQPPQQSFQQFSQPSYQPQPSFIQQQPLNSAIQQLPEQQQQPIQQPYQQIQPQYPQTIPHPQSQAKLPAANVSQTPAELTNMQKSQTPAEATQLQKSQTPAEATQLQKSQTPAIYTEIAKSQTPSQNAEQQITANNGSIMVPQIDSVSEIPQVGPIRSITNQPVVASTSNTDQRQRHVSFVGVKESPVPQNPPLNNVASSSSYGTSDNLPTYISGATMQASTQPAQPFQQPTTSSFLPQTGSVSVPSISSNVQQSSNGTLPATSAIVGVVPIQMSVTASSGAGTSELTFSNLKQTTHDSNPTSISSYNTASLSAQQARQRLESFAHSGPSALPPISQTGAQSSVQDKSSSMGTGSLKSTAMTSMSGTGSRLQRSRDKANAQRISQMIDAVQQTISDSAEALKQISQANLDASEDLPEIDATQPVTQSESIEISAVRKKASDMQDLQRLQSMGQRLLNQINQQRLESDFSGISPAEPAPGTGGSLASTDDAGK